MKYHICRLLVLSMTIIRMLYTSRDYQVSSLGHEQTHPTRDPLRGTSAARENCHEKIVRRKMEARNL